MNLGKALLSYHVLNLFVLTKATVWLLSPLWHYGGPVWVLHWSHAYPHSRRKVARCTQFDKNNDARYKAVERCQRRRCVNCFVYAHRPNILTEQGRLHSLAEKGGRTTRLKNSLFLENPKYCEHEKSCPKPKS
jgi:hypothetical protein